MGASSAQRTRLTNEVAAQLKSAGAPSDLASCVTQHSRGLPLASVREVARGGSNAQVRNLFATCVAQGKGVGSLRAMIMQSVRRNALPGMPAALTTCLEQKVIATRPSELASLVFAPSATQPGAAEARGRQFGAGLAKQCLGAPAMRPALLGLVLGPVTRGLSASHYSTGFKHCLLGKLRTTASAELVRMAADPTTAYSLGVQLGRSAAAACIASGARP